MKAILEHDIITSTIQFRTKNPKISFIYSVPSRLEKIIRIIDYDEGFITMQTNYGEEYTDLIEIVDQGVFTELFKREAISIISSLDLKDIVLKGV